MKSIFAAAACFAALTTSCAFAQNACHGAALAGTVHDSTQAIIPGAALTLDGVQAQTSSSDGRFRFSCVTAGTHHLTAAFSGFETLNTTFNVPHSGQLDLVLQPEEVQTQVDVSGDESNASSSPSSSGPTQTISGNRLQSLADDPDDLLRELQQLAAAAGGDPSNATISVDGFQESSKLPPKSSIAYIKVNPDQFSAEYREPPFEGGRVEVYTKPGKRAYHGALFATNGSPWENARDPFSTSKAALGKQRYGFELTGPLHKTTSDFTMTLEHRSIDNFAVVNAITLDPAGNSVNTVTNVATPQRLWVGTSRTDWQLGPKNTFIASYNANVNHLQNVGVGGTALADTGYDSAQYEHIIRLSDITTVSPRFMHEARASLRWNLETDTPISTAPQVQVSGAFTQGGATIGAQRFHQFTFELDDDAILTTKHHTIKFGTQLVYYRDHDQLTTNFNGTYTFGGGTAPTLDSNGVPVPGQTQTITGFEQYRRALLHLPGGTPTAFTNVTGTPALAFDMVRDASFIQDDWNVGHGVHIAYGLRYYLQSNPTLLDSFAPRLGILWSPNKKGTWTLHAHAGMFSGQFGRTTATEMAREDGINRITSTIYNPIYGDPFANATAVHSLRVYSPHMTNITWAAENIGGTRALPYGWNLSVDYYIGRFWNYCRTLNINSPLSDDPLGPRPGPANLNVLQVQPSGQGSVNATFVGIEQHTLKHIQLFFGGVRVMLVDDTDDNPFFSPQSSTSNVGEFAHRTNQPSWNLFGNATFHLPKKIDLSGNFKANGEGHYNITTGFDNNGDGTFNDRPQYASVGTPGAIPTRYGLLVASGGNGVFPRNQGVLPWTFYLDANLQRAFTLTRNAKAEHQQILTINLRAANLLNHTNVTQVGSVLGSPLFGIPFSADTGRRIEAGLRYSF